MSEHLGYDKHAVEGRNRGNSRNGTRAKTVLTDIGPVDIDVPRDRDGSFDPKTVKKRQRRLGGVDAMVISLCAKGLTTGEISAHLAEVYGAEVSKETISKITDAVIADMTEWLHRPLERGYVAVFIDAIVVKVRDGQATFSARVRRDRRHHRRHPRRAGSVDGYRRGGREVLAAGADGDLEPRHRGRMHGGL